MGAFFLVDVAAAEEGPPGSLLENRAEMNWVEVGWKEGQRLIILQWLSPTVLDDTGSLGVDYKSVPTFAAMYMYIPLSGFPVANPVGQA